MSAGQRPTAASTTSLGEMAAFSAVSEPSITDAPMARGGLVLTGGAAWAVFALFGNAAAALVCVARGVAVAAGWSIHAVSPSTAAVVAPATASRRRGASRRIH